LEEQLRKNNTGARPQIAALDKNSPAIAHQLEAENNAAISNSALNRFYLQLDKIHKEIARRVSDPTYDRTAPGGELVYEFRKALIMRGAEEALNHITEVKSTRVVGAGSSANRLLAYQRLWQVAGSMDPEGRRNLVEDIISEEVGQENVDRYLPPLAPEEARVPVDTAIAQFENNFFQDEKPSMVYANQDHFTHMSVHLPPIIETMNAYNEHGQNADLETLMKVFKVSMVAIPHCAQHIEFMSFDKSRAPETKQAIEIIQQASASSDRMRNQITRLMTAMEEGEKAEMARQQEEYTAYVASLEEKLRNSQGGDGEFEIQKQLVDAKAKAIARDIEFQQKLQHREAEFNQNMAFKQMEATNKQVSNL
jgi:hypothetical protein